MKKIVLLCMAALMIPSMAFAVGSWTTATYSATGTEQIGNFKWIQWTFTADAAAATVPTLTVSATDLAYIKGYYLYAVETNPGTTGPTDDAWDVVITDAQGLAITVSSLDATDTEMRYAPGGGYYPLDGKAITIDITDNAVNSATSVVRIWLVK